jgi:hypothetical protein
MVVLEGRPSVDTWLGVPSFGLVSARLGSKSILRRPAFSQEIRNSSRLVWRQFARNSTDFQPTIMIGEDLRCDVQTLEGLLSW